MKDKTVTVFAKILWFTGLLAALYLLFQVGFSIYLFFKHIYPYL